MPSSKIVVCIACNVLLAFCFSSAASQTSGERGKKRNPVVYANHILISDSPQAIQKWGAVQKAPEDMVYIPGGNVYIGSTEGLPDEQPRFYAAVPSFFMDQHPVTVAQFRQFVAATGYKTTAENFGNSGVLTEGAQGGWVMQEGAYWEYPQGIGAPKAKEDHPVTQVSWTDAVAYARWAGKRLPSELEWEHAARNARNDQQRYPWGNEAVANGQWLLNFWQGTFPQVNKVEDGFAYTSPVGYFGTTPIGLADMAGNVWEWCADDKIAYADLVQGNLAQKDTSEKAMRGGSFLCEVARCHGYRVSARSFSTPETSLMHIGFRCVKDITQK